MKPVPEWRKGWKKIGTRHYIKNGVEIIGVMRGRWWIDVGDRTHGEFGNMQHAQAEGQIAIERIARGLDPFFWREYE